MMQILSIALRALSFGNLWYILYYYGQCRIHIINRTPYTQSPSVSGDVRVHSVDQKKKDVLIPPFESLLELLRTGFRVLGSGFRV